MNEQDTFLDEINGNQLIWCGHVERMDPTRLPKIMINWKPEGRKKLGRPRKIWKDGIYRISQIYVNTNGLFFSCR